MAAVTKVCKNLVEAVRCSLPLSLQCNSSQHDWKILEVLFPDPSVSEDDGRMEAGDSIYFFPREDLRHTIFSKLEGSLCLASVSTQSMLTQPAKTVRLSGGVTSSLRREWSALWSVFYTVWGLGIQACIHTAISESPGTSFVFVQILTPPSLCTLQARLWI